MKILKYSYSDDPSKNTGWKIANVEFSSLNLIIGISGSGKTRLLNTISNLASVIQVKSNKSGYWNLLIEQNDSLYVWEFLKKPRENETAVFEFENLYLIQGDEKKQIVKRNQNSFFYNELKLPKLPRDESALSLLKEEDGVNPLYEGFNFFIRRTFSIENLKDSAQKHLINFNTKETVKYEKSLNKLILVHRIEAYF